MDYKKAGVDIEAGYKAVELMKEHVKGTMRPEVLNGLGGFSGAFALDRFMTMKQPTLLSGTDGVGTKLKYAFLLEYARALKASASTYIREHYKCICGKNAISIFSALC